MANRTWDADSAASGTGASSDHASDQRGGVAASDERPLGARLPLTGPPLRIPKLAERFGDPRRPETLLPNAPYLFESDGMQSGDGN
jgi:hypothetical protein